MYKVMYMSFRFRETAAAQRSGLNGTSTSEFWISSLVG